jgi:diguanylate cyclase (GGDEF)-like protein
LSKANKTYLIYAALGLFPFLLILFLDIDTKTGQESEHTFVHAFTHFFQYPLYMGFALVGFLGWKLNQNRILFSVLLFLGVCYLLFNPLMFLSWKINKPGLYFVIAMGFPLTLALVFSFRENRFLDLQYLSRLVLSLTPIVVLAFILARDLPGFKKIAYFKFLSLKGFLLPQLALVSLAIFGLVIFFQRDHKIKPFLKVIGISLIPLMAAIWAGLKTGPKVTDLSLHMVTAFTVICGILLHTIFQMYWHRVYVDELTDVANRRALDECLASLSGEYAIAMMDIDHFKSFNDNYGHDEGDNVLRLVGSMLRNELGDRIYRYGGEEFCAVFKGVSAEDAYMFANKVRRKLEERVFYIRKPNSKREPTSAFDRRKAKKSNNGKKVQITISIGLANPNKKSKTVEDVVKSADQALYEAKRKGRNRVVIWEIEGVKSAV